MLPVLHVLVVVNLRSIYLHCEICGIDKALVCIHNTRRRNTVSWFPQLQQRGLRKQHKITAGHSIKSQESVTLIWSFKFDASEEAFCWPLGSWDCKGNCPSNVLLCEMHEKQAVAFAVHVQILSVTHAI